MSLLWCELSVSGQWTGVEFKWHFSMKTTGAEKVWAEAFQEIPVCAASAKGFQEPRMAKRINATDWARDGTANAKSTEAPCIHLIGYTLACFSSFLILSDRNGYIYAGGFRWFYMVEGEYVTSIFFQSSSLVSWIIVCLILSVVASM